MMRPKEAFLGPILGTVKKSDVAVAGCSKPHPTVQDGMVETGEGATHDFLPTLCWWNSGKNTIQILQQGQVRNSDFLHARLLAPEQGELRDLYI